MEAVGAALPEFDSIRGELIATPEGGEGDGLVGIFLFNGFECIFEGGAVGDDVALGGGPSAELAIDGAGVEVGFGFLLGGTGGGAFDTDLSIERGPVEGEGGLGVFGEVVCFGAFVVCEEAEAGGVEVF